MWPPAALVTFDSLRNGPEWRRWGKLTADAPPYLAPQFFELVRPLVGHGTPFVAEAWTADRMLGALPLVLDGDRLRALRTDQSPGFDYCGTADGIDAIWDSLRDDERWNELVLDKVPADSLLASRLPELARLDGCPVTIKPDTRHPYFALAGFEAAMQPKFRTNVQRCARKAADLVLERIMSPSADDLADATRIEGMAWKDAAGTSIASDRRVAQVYEDLARFPAASLYFLRSKGVRIATLFALEDRRTLFALKIGYDPAYASISPGHLLVWTVAKDAEARGLAEWNFVGREDEWKRRWTERVHEQVSIVVYRRSARGLVRHTLRDVIKPRLPEQMRATPKSPIPRHCQRADYIGDHALLAYARISLVVGLCAPIIGLTIGGALGMLSGYFRGRFEIFVVGSMDVLLAFPPLILVLAVIAFLGQSILNLTFILGVLGIPAFMRVARAATLTLARREFVIAAQALGATHARILLRELLPNVMLPLFAFFLLGVAVIIVVEGALVVPRARRAAADLELGQHDRGGA